MHGPKATLSRRPRQIEQARLLPGLRGIGLGLLVLCPIAVCAGVVLGLWSGVLLGGLAGLCGLVFLTLAALAGAIFEIADRLNALSDDPRFQ